MSTDSDLSYPQRRFLAAAFQAVLTASIAACTTPNPHYRGDMHSDGGGSCTPNEFLRCDDTALVRCNADGTAEVNESCALGCDASDHRCSNLAPSNGLAPFLDEARSHPDLNLGDSSTINTDTGVVTVGSSAVPVKTDTLAQSGAPMIRVLIVHSLTAKQVSVTGQNALAVVSDGDIDIQGTFDASAKSFAHGAGAFIDGGCAGGRGQSLKGAQGGSGGGGFGLPGGSGGAGAGDENTATGGMPGAATGNESLVPLRGGCDGGITGGTVEAGAGGGAVQLVSQTRIAVSGTLTVNGGGGNGWETGGGSGGGIVLEAATVEVTGTIVANGGGGGGSAYSAAADGRLDAQPASGGAGFANGFVVGGHGGGGGATTSGAGNGEQTAGVNKTVVSGGGGGGGVGRIRINTAPDGLHATMATFSPNPSHGELGTR